MEWPSQIQKRQFDAAHAALRKWESMWNRQLDEASAALRKSESLGPLWNRQLDAASAALRKGESLWESLWVSAAGHRQLVDARTEPSGLKTDDSPSG